MTDANQSGVQMSVWNNGNSNAGQADGSGLGTLGLADRINALGGQLSIGPDKSDRGGWVVDAFIPVAQETGRLQ